MTLFINAKDGVRLTSPIVNLNLALVANAVVVWTISVGALQVGTKSVRLLTARFMNNAAGLQIVHIGTGVGVGFVDLVPAMESVNNLSDVYDLGRVEAFANITAYPDALVALGTIDIQLDVEEIG